MTFIRNSKFEEFSTTKPPFFNGTDFNYWKTRMKCFLKSLDYCIWYIVMHGDIIPKKKVDDIFITKVHEELDDKDNHFCLKMLRQRTF